MNAKGAGSVGVSDKFYTDAPPTTPVATSVVYDQSSASATIIFSSEYADKYLITDPNGNVFESDEGSYVATGLEENQIYVYTVVAINDVGSSEAASITVNTAAVPHTPTNLTAGAYADGSVVLTWDDVDAETGYRVFVQNGSIWTQIGSDLATGTTRFEATGLSDYETYTFCVAAFNEVGESSKSVSVVVDTTVAPSKPTGLTFTFGESATYQGDGKATFVWNAVDHASGYQIQQKVNGVWTTITSTPNTSYDLTGLVNYATYDYRVAAYAQRGTERLYSPYATASLATDWVPTGDIALSAGGYDAATKSVVLTWNGLDTATGYNIEQYANGDWTVVGSTNETTYTLDLADNVDYTFRVVAVNAVGTGSTSNSVNFFTWAAPAKPVVGGRYDSATFSATITFSSAYATEYVVTDGNGTELYKGPDTSFVHAGLEENETYQYVVVASNAYGVSPEETFTLYTAAVPAAPTNLTFGEYADGSADLSWSPVYAATGYRVYVQNGSAWTQFGSDLVSNSVRLTGLSDFNVYAFCVAAFNDEGESVYSAPATLDTTVAPAAPNVFVTYGGEATYKGDGKATLIWDAVDHAAGYYVAQKIGGAWSFIAETTDLAFDVSGLDNFNAYEYGVAAYATRGADKLASAYAPVTIDTTWVPEGVLTLTVGSYDYVAKTAALSWTSVEHATKYRIDVRNSSGELAFSATTAGLTADVALSDNEAYAIRVTAFNVVGDGAYDEKTIVAYAPPAAPSDAVFGEFVAETGKATISWSDVPFAEWYEVTSAIDDPTGFRQTDVPSYTVEGLVEDMNYTYYVRACNHIGESAEEGYSDWVEVTLDTHTATIPNAPSDFELVDYDEATVTAKLVWRDNSGNEEQFIIQRSLDGTTWTDLAYLEANVKSYQVANLQRGVTYYFRIAASNQYGASEWVSCSFAVPTGVPEAPSNVRFSEYDDESKVFEMSWDDNSTNELYFKVEYSTDGETWGGARTVSANTNSVEWSNLTEGQIYHFRVSAWNNYGGSDYAYNSYQIPIDGKVTPAAPSNLVFGAFNYDSRSVSMSWTNNGQDASDSADSFVIEYSFDGMTWRSGGSTAGNVTTKTATGMIAGRTYHFRVCARNAAGDSGWTTGSFEAPTSIPAPNGFVIGNYVDGDLETSWTYGGTLSEDGGFIVQYSYDNNSWNRAGDTKGGETECVIHDVSRGRTYYFRVAAYDGGMYSEWIYSDPYSAPTGAPNAPTGLKFSQGDDEKSVKLSWTDNSNTEVGFDVQYSVDEGETWVSAGKTNKDVADKTIAQLRPDTTYQFRVRAYNYYGGSNWLVGSYAVPRSGDVPNAPTDVAIANYDASAKKLTLTWADRSNNETGFRVQYSYDGSQWYAAGSCKSNVEEWVKTGLVAGRSYQFRVCAYNDEGQSDWAYGDAFPVSGAILEEVDDDTFDLLSNSLLETEPVDAYFVDYLEEEF